MESFAGKRVVILGLARQGTALATFFHSRGAQVTISDLASPDQLAEPLAALAGTDVRLVLGDHPPSLLNGCHMLCLSGGVPPQISLVRAARRQGIRLSNDALLTIAGSPAPTVGITGSSGKTTTTTLVGLMLEASGLKAPVDGRRHSGPGAHRAHVWVGGNIGIPLIDRLDQAERNDILVLELSSFQLELFDEMAGGSSLSPHIATVLNVTPNHLDRHPSMANYTACKANILRWQHADDVAVLGSDNEITGRWLRELQVTIEAGQGQQALNFAIEGQIVGFGFQRNASDGCWLDGEQLMWQYQGQEHPVVDVTDIGLPGRHNVLNVMAACATAGAAGASSEAMRKVARTFAGVPHRLELVREANGVVWINDSIATTPERAAAALHSFDQPIILLAGGRDKKLSWTGFSSLVLQKVKHLILFGEAAGLIWESVVHARPEPDIEIVRCENLADAVEEAARVARPGDLVLLSPGGTSYDAYRDFEARGNHYRRLVAAL
ncbi:MAG: UDP-N-acetylmuramoyl-L-alanine--D-glutamate ligase [Chloroflexota bacterium]|nr:UDP-N-acetylmuramoyl-L-alanine--D-glutamate ligase [Chloroflexota bacterium]